MDCDGFANVVLDVRGELFVDLIVIKIGTWLQIYMFEEFGLKSYTF
jgi:hypothetical protein